MTEAMTKEAAKDLIRMLKGSVIGFFIDPDVAYKSWYSILGKYTKREVWNAVNTMLNNSDAPPTAHGIKSLCDRVRQQEEEKRRREEARRQIEGAKNSLEDVPGNNRFEKVAYITGQRAAEHWIAGEHDNDFYNSRILTAQKLGFEFNGVDYSKVRVSAGYSDPFAAMAKMANSGAEFK